MAQKCAQNHTSYVHIANAPKPTYTPPVAFS